MEPSPIDRAVNNEKQHSSDDGEDDRTEVELVAREDRVQPPLSAYLLRIVGAATARGEEESHGGRQSEGKAAHAMSGSIIGRQRGWAITERPLLLVSRFVAWSSRRTYQAIMRP